MRRPRLGGGALTTVLLHLSVTVDVRIKAFLSGDRQAGQQLLLELLPRVRNVIRALIGRDAEVDDIAQLVMVNVISGLAGYRGDSPLVGWVDRITVRVTLRHMRTVRARSGRHEAFDEQAQLGPAIAGLAPAALLSDQESYLRKRDAVRLLDALPTLQKTAMVLHHGLGFSVQEAAEHEQTSVETIRSRLRLALRKLRAWTSEATAEVGSPPAAEAESEVIR